MPDVAQLPSAAALVHPIFRVGALGQRHVEHGLDTTTAVRSQRELMIGGLQVLSVPNVAQALDREVSSLPGSDELVWPNRACRVPVLRELTRCEKDDEDQRSVRTS